MNKESKTFTFITPLEYEKNGATKEIREISIRKPMAIDLRGTDPHGLVNGEILKILFPLIDYKELNISRTEFEEAFEEAEPEDVQALMMILAALCPTPDFSKLGSYIPKKEDRKKIKEIIYPLSHPIDYGSEEISSVVIKRPKYKHMKRLHIAEDGFKYGDALDLLGSLCALSPGKVERMEIADFQVIKGILAYFLYSGLETALR